MNKIIIVKTSAIGDVIQTFPAIEYIKKFYPHALIDWVVEKPIASLLKSHPEINHVWEVDTKKWRYGLWKHRKEIAAFLSRLRTTSYDVLFDLQGNTKSGLITLFAHAKEKVGYSWTSVPEKPNFFVTNRRFVTTSIKEVRKCTLSLVQQFFQDRAEFQEHGVSLRLSDEEENRLRSFSFLGALQPKIMICFGSKWKNKQLSEKTLSEFIQLIQQKISPHFFFIFGNKEEEKIARHLHQQFPQSDAVGEMSLQLLQRFMSIVDYVVAMDSAALHLCGTTQTPSFSIFGPSSPEVYKPTGDQHRVYQGSCPYGEKFEKRCRLLRTCTTGSCMKDISSSHLFEHFYNAWISVSKSTPLSTI